MDNIPHFSLKVFLSMLNELCHVTIRFSGIALLMRKVLSRKNVTIVLYHKPSKKNFEAHLKYLSSKYEFISMSELSSAIYSKNWINIPDYAMVITFDDGWKENYDLLDLFIKYNVRPTIYIASHLIDTDRNFWWTICNEADIDRLKRFPNNNRLMELKEKFGFYPQKEYIGRRQTLNKIEIDQMKEFVEFGLHTCYHPILTKCTDNEKSAEIIECKIRLEKLLDRKIETFAYPNGNYDYKCIEILKEHGVKTARTVDVGWNSKIADPYRLKILYVSDNVSISKLISQLTGIPLYIHYLRKGSFTGLNEQL